MPVLSECKDKILSNLEDPRQLAFEYNYYPLDIILKSHPNIVGFIEIYSFGATQEGLQATANRYLSDCYPETSVSIDINDNNYPQKIKNRINTNETFGFLNNYIVSKEGKIKIYWHQKPDVIYKQNN